MLSLRLDWGNGYIDDPTWDQVAQAIEASQKNGCAVTMYNKAAESSDAKWLMLEVDEDIGVFHPALLFEPTDMRFFENINGGAETIEFNANEASTGVLTDDIETVLRLAKEFYETGDVKEMKGWDELFFNIKKD